MGDRLKHWVYNTVKTTQSNYNSKSSFKLQSEAFFKPRTRAHQQSTLLHSKYINRTNCPKNHVKYLNDKFSMDFQSITWFTYRDHLEMNLQGSSLKSDSGWGCMLRTGQMILFQALKRHLFGESFKLEMLSDSEISVRYLNLLRLFMDNCPPGPLLSVCPFGIHSIAAEGRQQNIQPGQWYGPQMISIVFRNICDKFQPVPNFKIHVCLDGVIIFEEIAQLITQGNSVMVLIPVRLGLDSIQPEYLSQVKDLFEITENVGIAGGQDYKALYLVGLEDLANPKGGMIYLDPHFI